MRSEQTRQHLEMLYGNLDEGEGLIEVASGLYNQADGGFPETGPDRFRAERVRNVEEACVLVERLASEGREVYICGSTGAPRRGLRRFKKTDTLRTCGLWADIDISEGHEGNAKYPPTKAIAEEVLRRVGLPPTLLLDTGGGLQAWWLFDELADTSTEELREAHERRQRELVALINVHAHEMGGWRFDSVVDCVRVLRVAGTENHKRPTVREVTILDADGPRYSGIGAFDERCSSVETLIKAGSGGAGDPLRLEIEGVLAAGTLADVDRERLEVLKDNDVKFRQSWNGERKDLKDDDSSLDASIAFHAARVGTPPVEIARLVAYRRSYHGDPKNKGQRPDYLARTVAWALEAVARRLTEDEAIHQQRVVELDAMDEKGGELLERARESCGLPDLVGVTQRGRENASFYFEFEDGESVHVGAIDVLRSNAKLTNRLLEARSGRSILRKKTRDEWDKVSLMLVRVARVEEIPENERARELRILVAEYSAGFTLHADEDVGPTEGDWKMAALTDTPFLYKGRLCFRPDALYLAAKARGYELVKREFRKVCLEAGASSVSVHFEHTGEGRRVHRRCVGFDPFADEGILESVRERAVTPGRWEREEPAAARSA